MGNVIMSIDKKSVDFIPTIMRIVSKMEGIDQDLLMSSTRKREVVQARQIAMYFAKQYTKSSLATIGKAIGKKDHATVLHANKVVNNLSDTDRYYRGRLHQMRESIEEAALRFECRDSDLVCTECGSKSIKSTAWINPNNDRVIELVDAENPAINWCNECAAFIALMPYKDYLDKVGAIQVLDEVPENPDPGKIIIDNRSTERKFFDKTVKEISEEF